uniref:taste receptor type 2 member 39 n=1 Tax=Jaculus jaculus TaxID=51337 RepID=UPI000333418D|nr:taste receptor type 2 member 39 [Jaculus jaculus]
MAEPSDSRDHNFSLVIILIFTIIITECTVGIAVNGFIVAVNAASWLQKKAVSTSGRILLFLSVSRTGLQIFMLLEVILVAVLQDYYYKTVLNRIFKVSSIFLNYCSLWIAAWLSFFYFVKIVNSPYPVFLKLKWRISRSMPWLLWSSVFISFSSSMLYWKNNYSVHSDMLAIHLLNFTKETHLIKTNMLSVTFSSLLGIFTPLIIFITAAALLIFSLKRHTLHMRSSGTGSQDPSMEAHMRAIKETSYFLILYILNAVALLLSMSNISKTDFFWTIFFRIIIAAYPAGHSILLVHNNPGLRRAWKQLQSQIHLNAKGF